MSKPPAIPIPTPRSGLPSPQPRFPEVPNLEPNTKPLRHGSRKDASPAGQKIEYYRGAAAGKHKEPGDRPKTREERPSKSFEHGYLDAQKVRSDRKPSS